MKSTVLDPDLATAIDQVHTALDAAFPTGINPVDVRDAAVMVRETEVLARRLHALQVDQLSAIDQRGLHRHDGHASAKVMVRHNARLSGRGRHLRQSPTDP